MGLDVISVTSIWPSWNIFTILPQDWVNLHLSSFYYLISHSFFHKVHLALPDDFHQLVLKRNNQLLPWLTLGLLVGTSEALDAFHTTSLGWSSICSGVVLGTWIDKEWIVFG